MRKKKRLKLNAWKAGLVFTGLIIASGASLVDIMTGAMTAVFLMIISGCLQIHDAYRAIQGSETICHGRLFRCSACFALPIGYQANLLVLGTDGYRFSDYLKLGIPLYLLIWIMGTSFIPKIWPFN